MPERFGESAQKEQKAKALLREGKLSYKQIAAAVGTSKSQVQRFSEELRQEQRSAPGELPYEPSGEPRWRPPATDFELMEERLADLTRMNAQLVSDSLEIVRRNRELRAQLGLPLIEETAA